jgi:hypothetical protein
VLPQLPDRPDSKVRVFYQYFYHNDERHVVEKMAGYKCAFCRMVCRSLTVRLDTVRCNHAAVIRRARKCQYCTAIVGW